MLEIISTLASVISAVFQVADFFGGKRPKRSTRSRSTNRSRERIQVTQAKMVAVAENLWSHSVIILISFLVVVVICAALSVLVISEFSWLSFLPAWSIILALVILSLGIIYAVVVSIAWVIINRELQYYSLSQDAISIIKITIGEHHWRDPLSKWFIQEAFRQMARLQK
jgi:hypothetical protein